MRRRLVPLLVALCLACAPGLLLLRAENEPVAPAAPVHPSPWKMTSTADGRTLFVSLGPWERVAFVDVDRRARLLEGGVEVGGMPRALALSPDEATLAVTLSDRDEVVLLDVARRVVIRRLRAGRAPEGVAFTPDGRRLFVANRLSEDVSVLDVETGRETHRLQAGREPYALAMSPDGATVAVVSRRVEVTAPDEVPVAQVTLIDVAATRVRARVMLPSCHMIDDAAFTPDGRRLLVPAIRVRNLLPIVQVARGWVLSAVLACVDVERGAVALLPLQYANEGFADPTGIALSADGTRAYVASGGADEVAVIDVARLLEHEKDVPPEAPERFALTKDYVLRRVKVGDNPRGVVWLGRGSVGDVAIASHLDDDVYLLDRDGGLRARLPLAHPIPDDVLHRGRRAFFDATVCFQNAFSCTSCHPEGHTDGLTYDFEIDGVGRNPVLNRSLLGLAGTAPFKWIGLNPTIQRQCGARFAMVLTRAQAFPPETLDDLAAYLLSIPPPLPTLHEETEDEDVRAAIERGRRIFHRSRVADGRRLSPTERCVSCHPPPLYTNLQVTEVGSRGRLDDHDRYDVPHLTGTGSKAPYLHDGSAFALKDIFRRLGDGHGFVSDLSDADLDDLVAYLRSL